MTAENRIMIYGRKTTGPTLGFFTVVNAIILGLGLLLLLRNRLILSRAWRDWPLNVGAFLVLLFRQAKPQFCPLG
jgi:hypothetical protein